MQIKGVDFGKTFAPVVKFNTIRIILTIAMAMGSEIHQMDITTTFLNGKLDVEIHMEQLEGFVQNGREHLICKLNKFVLRIEAIWTSVVRVYSHIVCE